ncbi:hypothetical protein RBSH_01435 [Rhodopirellula baltica SH28]|uniref:Uncharacterized protein n=4 Tax=Rhodopirellula baltica TaxID=265606 RepID=Q7UNS1_RHOBA|nr:hypothetical protein RBWH47_03435 [Rhodopirellula baltica WH47]EKK03125.1 hypothetical protein RBSH_01435 [Rhodopirellula baltica SH28]ELP34712.1 hypothetical protein RBSWK_01219 [Rhodopirellula baltica SWK14]CAD75347.1 hypothetical protein RB7411 [Rhodopirellula baltica SH 1]
MKNQTLDWNAKRSTEAIGRSLNDEREIELTTQISMAAIRGRNNQPVILRLSLSNRMTV